MARSRLNQKLVKQTERNLLLIGAIGMVVLVIFIFFGVKLLVNFSLFVEKKPDTNAEQAQEETFMAIPTLDYLADATNSASIEVSGIAASGKYVKLYLNGRQLKKADIKSDNTFVFHDVTLESGENDIKVKAVSDDNKESRFSETLTVTYSNEPPKLSIDTPSDGQTYNKERNPLRVSGKTDPNVRVTVNDFWAVVDGQGNYYYSLPLKNGANEIKVVATDEAGNKAEKTLHVTYAE